ncbi:MAG: D-alanyl-D-alanine carboxypeptidase/D-alanyl-D-alanine-endopeptidase [Candidatus Marinimicrobia bacterium]|nr:D-alanyl-D-alanine carboxypeptidase/D-alanyl-D-alanine-endopeptidase [Candidatus Neomarinimicrobiota bacterium]
MKHQKHLRQPFAIMVYLLFFLLSGCSQAPAIYKVRGQPLLSHKIKTTIDQSGLTTNIGLKVVALKTGKTLYQLNSDHLFTPASNNKLYTAAAALYYLGPDYNFRTTVWIDSSGIIDGKVGTLILKGGGDPDLSLVSLDSLAEVVSRNIISIDTLIIDNTRLDSVRFGEGWMWDEGAWWYAAQIDAMTLNDNCIDIDIAPGQVGQPPVIAITPNTAYISIINQAQTVDDTVGIRALKIERHWWDFSNIFDITGDILITADRDTIYRNIDSPARYSGQVFSEYLIRHGVEFKGPILIKPHPPEIVSIAEHVSDTLSVILHNFLKESDNLTGELLVKTIGLETSDKQGNWKNGLTAIKKFLNDIVILDTTAIRMVDGSGVSRYNLTSPDQLVAILQYVYSQSGYQSDYLAALPLAGFDGTLENRMENDVVRGKILAKTGTLSGASCLSGYVFTKAGDPLAFSIMMNGYVGSSGPYRQLQDDICAILATH